MKSIINGKSYDTEKSEMISEYSFSNPNDFNFISEELYKTRKGAWFLYGRGGPNSKYREPVGDGSVSGGSAITPLTEEEAFEWLQDHKDTEAIEKYFNEWIEEA